MSSENLMLRKKMQELQAFFKSIDRKKSKTTFTEQYTQKTEKDNKESYESSEDKEDGSTTTATETLCNSLKVSLNINPQRKKKFKFYQVALIRSMPVVNL